MPTEKIKRWRRVPAVCIALGFVLLPLLAPSAASAYSSGQFTKAVATPDWTHGSFVAQVSAAPCGTGYCSYFPIVFAQPSLPEYGCESEEFADDDRDTEEVWKGSTETTNTSFEAAAANVPILHGVYGQRYCLELVGEREHPDYVCEVEKTVFPELLCPPEKSVFGEYVTGAIMTVETTGCGGDPLRRRQLRRPHRRPASKAKRR